MFRPLQGHHQAFYLKQVFKILHACSLLLSTIKNYVFDVLIILFFAITVMHRDV